MGGYVPRGSIGSVGPPPGAFNATTLAKQAEPVEPIILASDYGYNYWPTHQRERPRWGYWLRLAWYALTHPYTRTRVGC